MLIRFILNSETALAFAAAASLIAGLLMNNNIGYAVLCLVSSMVGAGAVGQVQQKSSLLKAGVVTGLANMVLVLGLSLFSGQTVTFDMLFSIILAFSGGILSAVIVTGVAQSFAGLFGYTTDIKLLELANLNHPLLKELIVQAPGSYHHRIVV